MGKVDNKTLEVRPGGGQAKTITLPIQALAVLQVDGTALDVSAADPMPTTDAAVLAALGGDTSGLTFTNFDLDEAVAGIADLGTSAAGALKRLVELDFTALAQCTVDIGYDDDGAGTNAVVLRGPYTLGAGGGINKEFRSDPRGAIAEAPDGKHLTITFTTAGGGGGGRISTGA